MAQLKRARRTLALTTWFAALGVLLPWTTGNQTVVLYALGARMTVVVGLDEGRLRRRRRCRRHIGMERRGLSLTARAVHATMIELCVGIKVIGRWRLLRPMLGIRPCVGHHMELLGRPRWWITGNM